MISLEELKTNTQLWFNPKFPYQKLDKKQKKMLKFQLVLKIELYI